MLYKSNRWVASIIEYLAFKNNKKCIYIKNKKNVLNIIIDKFDMLLYNNKLKILDTN